MDRIRDTILGLAAFGSSIFPGNFENRAPTPPIPEVQQSMHEAFHYPEIDGKKTEATAYLTLPFRKKDLEAYPLRPGEPYDITEGWVYSAKELRIHKGSFVHVGVDYHVRYGTPVVAPTDGYAISSYHTYRLKDDQKKELRYEGKPINMGLGYFVRIYNSQVNRTIEIGHLSDIYSTIPFSPPEKDEENNGWKPTNHDLKTDEWATNPKVVYVRKGTTIGKVGYSGLTWGYDEYRKGAERPVGIDPNVYKSWDEPHVHFEEFGRDKENKMGWERDPYGIYNTYDQYPTPKRKAALGKDPLFFIGDDGLPKYADE